MNKSNKFSSEVRARSVRRVLKHRRKPPSLWTAADSMSTRLARCIGMKLARLGPVVQGAGMLDEPEPTHGAIWGDHVSTIACRHGCGAGGELPPVGEVSASTLQTRQANRRLR